MIEINLIPDIKREFIKAQRLRNVIILGSGIVVVVAIGLCILVASYVFGVQAFRDGRAETQIKEESSKLKAVDGIDSALTIQNQVSKLADAHKTKHISTRIVDLLVATAPSAPDEIQISRINLDTENKQITIEAQARNGFSALEVFRKTIDATELAHGPAGERTSVKIASQISDANRSFSEDDQGSAILRFELSFTYTDELFSNDLISPEIVAPSRRVATDSYVGVPQTLFTTRDNREEE